MDINRILDVNNDIFRKDTNNNKKGYLFDSQINTAKEIIRNLKNPTIR